MYLGAAFLLVEGTTVFIRCMYFHRFVFATALLRVSAATLSPFTTLPRPPALFVPYSPVFPVQDDDFYFLTPVMGPLATFSESTDYRSTFNHWYRFFRQDTHPPLYAR